MNSTDTEWKYEIVVRYEREGSIYYDEYYYVRASAVQAITDVKKDWHGDNDHLFPEAVDAEFFVKTDI